MSLAFCMEIAESVMVAEVSVSYRHDSSLNLYLISLLLVTLVWICLWYPVACFRRYITVLETVYWLHNKAYWAKEL